jgi:hypothetical protein
MFIQIVFILDSHVSPELLDQFEYDPIRVIKRSRFVTVYAGHDGNCHQYFADC